MPEHAHAPCLSKGDFSAKATAWNEFCLGTLLGLKTFTLNFTQASDTHSESFQLLVHVAGLDIFCLNNQPRSPFKENPKEFVLNHLAVGQNQWYYFWGRCTTHFSLFLWGLGCSLGVRAFDPWPFCFEHV